MSDANLRALERRWRESGSVADEAAWLTARSRTGDLARERLELAAYCGHPAARHAVGEDVTIARASHLGATAVRIALGQPLAKKDGLAGWLRGLVTWGDEVCARAVLAALEIALEPYEPRYGSGPREFAGLAQSWLEEGRTPTRRERRSKLSWRTQLMNYEEESLEEMRDPVFQTAWSLARAVLVGPFHGDGMEEVAIHIASLDQEAVRRGMCAALTIWSLERAP